MKTFFNVPSHLYVDKHTLDKMESGEEGRGSIYPLSCECELIQRHAFQPVTDEDILGNGWYRVFFMVK